MENLILFSINVTLMTIKDKKDYNQNFLIVILLFIDKIKIYFSILNVILCVSDIFDNILNLFL